MAPRARNLGIPSRIVAPHDAQKCGLTSFAPDPQCVLCELIELRCQRLDFAPVARVLQLMKDIPLVSIEESISEIVETYIRHQVMPSDPVGDALHLAVASYHKCDFLLTWNSRHLANANKFAQIRRVNAMLGLFVPMLVTPLELLGGVST